MKTPSARELVGRKITGFALNAFSNGRGGTAHDPIITLDDGSRLAFTIEETDVGENGIGITRHLRSEDQPKQKGQSQFNLSATQESYTFHFTEETSEVNGSIAVERSAYRIEIFVEGFREPVAGVDLFYLKTDYGEGRARVPQILINDTVCDDNVAFARFHKHGTRVHFETGVESYASEPGDEDYGTAYGYPPEDTDARSTDNKP